MVKITRFLRKRRRRTKKYDSKRRLKVNNLNQKKLSDWSLGVRKRNGFKCTNCRSTQDLHAHHMVSKFYMPKYAYTLCNGITLCKKCHLGYGGVHHKNSRPTTSLISCLRRVFKMSDIHTAKILSIKFLVSLLYPKPLKRRRKRVS